MEIGDERLLHVSGRGFLLYLYQDKEAISANSTAPFQGTTRE